MSTQSSQMLLVGDVMLTMDRVPVIQEKTIFKEALEEMGRTHLGMVCIVNSSQQLLGILTDGDVRRKLLEVQKPSAAFFVDDALNHSIRAPVVVNPESSLRYAIELMEQKQIWDLPVIENDILVGLLHLHPAVQALLAAHE